MLTPRRFVPLLAAALAGVLPAAAHAADPLTDPTDDTSLEWSLPNESLKRPFAEQVPIVFVSRGQNRKEWEALPRSWNETTEEVADPGSKKTVTRRLIKIKLPLGINLAPPVPVENPMTLARWELGKRLYFDPVLSSTANVSCASCHAPELGFTDQVPVSVGIGGIKGGTNAPTVLNSAFNRQHFWDGRATTLEDQAQGPVQSSFEMFSGKGHAWNDAIRRVRAKGDFNKKFEEEFGHLPTRDAIAKAIATYERTVLVGNSIQDRAEVAMRKRVEGDEGTNFTIQPKDYEAVLKQAFTAKDTHALEALLLNPDKDQDKVPAVAAAIDRGRQLFFGKARCNACHVGESFTDLAYHNLGVGVKDGKLPAKALGRFGALPTGLKDPALVGAFKTPPLRGLLSTKPYMHDGSEATLEAVVDFYDRGGNANEFLDVKMRDYDAEEAYLRSKQTKAPWTGPEVKVFTRGGRPIIPLKLGLTPDEKKDLVTFLRALESDLVDPTVADPKWFPTRVAKR
jgi:cytochrome c peroxidase